jgi:hypothetical protein
MTRESMSMLPSLPDNPPIFYMGLSYVSFERTARDYAALLKAHLVTDPNKARVSILHAPPHVLSSLIRLTPALANTYRIGYLAWEADTLPPALIAELENLNEIWTPSHFCKAVFDQYHPRVFVVPHVVRQLPEPALHHRRWLDGLIAHDPEHIYFTAFAVKNQTRKNTSQLLRAFVQVAPQMPRARLIVKSFASGPPSPHRHAVMLERELPAPQVHALIKRSHVIASPHHGEGWGLNLSDAMAEGKLVVATAYSGNMHFMTAQNALLVDYALDHVRPGQRDENFDESMRWAFPSQTHLEAQLLHAYRLVTTGDVSLQTQAKNVIRLFSEKNVKDILMERLATIANLLG